MMKINLIKDTAPKDEPLFPTLIEKISAVIVVGAAFYVMIAFTIAYIS